MTDLTKKKWLGHVSTARQRGLSFLTLDQYREKLNEAGITPEQVGLASNQFHLARRTDRGDYTVDSCRFITVAENQKERILNGGAARTGEKNRAIIKGKTAATHEHIAVAAAKSALARKGRRKEDHPYIAEQAKKLSKPYSFLSPDGVVHQGTNLNEFCKIMNLQQPLMTLVRSGKAKHHKGWTRYKE